MANKSLMTIQKITIKRAKGTNFCDYKRDFYKKLSLGRYKSIHFGSMIR